MVSVRASVTFETRARLSKTPMRSGFCAKQRDRGQGSLSRSGKNWRSQSLAMVRPEHSISITSVSAWPLRSTRNVFDAQLARQVETWKKYWETVTDSGDAER